MKRSDAAEAPPSRWRAWWDARHPRSDTVTLTQRNVYILPTRAGWLCAGLLLLLLIGSINYQLNLGYLLTFVLASAATASMVSCHATLRGLQLALRAPAPVHAGELAVLEVSLHDPAQRPRARHGIGLRLDLPEAASGSASPQHDGWIWIDLPAAPHDAGQVASATTRDTQVALALQARLRGWQLLPAVRLETRFPFGLFRAWSVWRPAARLLVWPAAERNAPPLPLGHQHGGTARPTQRNEERDGVRSYRRGDGLTQIAWKKSAPALAGSGELVSRDQPGAREHSLQLRWDDTSDASTHSVASATDPADPAGARLARLTAWLLAADRSGAAYSLELPGAQLAVGRGDAHRRQGLDLLATWNAPDRAGAEPLLRPAVAPAMPLSLAPATDRPARLPRETRDTLVLLGALAWTLLPQFGRVPLWCSALALLALAWRAWLTWCGAALPARWLLALALLASGLLTWQEHHSLFGKEAGVTLLVLLATLKTLELRARRDHWVVFGLGFFLILANFLYSQSLATALAMLAAVLGLLTALTLAHMPSGRPPLRQAMHLAAHQVLLGAPLVLLLFVFFPRVAPLWSVPGESLTARSGLSEHLSLGDVADLALDDSLAMRVRFKDMVPPPEARYFRGPVLVYHDGRQWLADPGLPPALAQPPNGQPRPQASADSSLSYEMTVEPLRVRTLPLLELTLDRPQFDTSEITLQQRPDLQWVSNRPLAERLRLQAVAHLAVRWPGASEAVSPALVLERILPPDAHPRSVAWARQLRSTPALAHADADQLAMALLKHIRTGGYVYTLSPGSAEGGDPLDQFWLDHRQGFCEHYASAFVVLMRAMGVPARIVTGYQGGQFNPLDGVLEVRQSDAHAWAEYWRTGHGWVRVDPTAAVAPERVRQGRRLRTPPGFVGNTLVAWNPALAESLRQVWSALDHRWNQWVLNHDQARQRDLLRRLGWPDVDALALGRALLIGLAGLGLLAAAWAAWDQRRNRPRRDPWLRAWATLQKQLRRHGLVVAAHETPGRVADAVLTRWGPTAQGLADALHGFEHWRYGPDSAADQDTRPALRRQMADVRLALRHLPRLR